MARFNLTNPTGRHYYRRSVTERHLLRAAARREAQRVAHEAWRLSDPAGAALEDGLIRMRRALCLQLFGDGSTAPQPP